MTVVMLRVIYSIYLLGGFVLTVRMVSLAVFERKWTRFALFIPVWPLSLFSRKGIRELKTYVFGKGGKK